MMPRSKYSHLFCVMLFSLLIPFTTVLAEENTGKETPATTKEPTAKRLVVNGITIVFTGDNEAVIETAGQSVKINTATQSAVDMAGTPAPAGTAAEPATAGQVSTADPAAEVEEDIDPESYYGYELINVPTPRRYEKNAFSIHFTHRFSQPVFNRSAADLFGLDSFSTSGLGFSYGITDRIFAKIYRTPLFRTIELGGGVHLLHQGEKSPLSAQVYASVEGQDNFNENFTTNIVGMLGRSFSRYGSAFFAPTVSINSNPTRIGGPREDRNTGSFGFGGQVNFRPTASFLFEYTPRIGFKNAPDAAIGFGLQKRTYRHVFTLTVSNTIGTTTSQYNSGFGDFSRTGLSNGLTIGFNIWRRFF